MAEEFKPSSNGHSGTAPAEAGALPETVQNTMPDEEGFKGGHVDCLRAIPIGLWRVETFSLFFVRLKTLIQ